MMVVRKRLLRGEGADVPEVSGTRPRAQSSTVQYGLFAQMYGVVECVLWFHLGYHREQGPPRRGICEKLQEWGGAVWGESALRSRASRLLWACLRGLLTLMAAWTSSLCELGHLVGPVAHASFMPELVMPKARPRLQCHWWGELGRAQQRCGHLLVSFTVPSAAWQAGAGICLQGF